MTRSLYVLWLFGWFFGAMCIASLFVFMGIGIIDEGGKTEPWGEFGAMFLVLGIVVLGANSFWTDYMRVNDIPRRPKPKTKLNREDRKKLKAEQSRIELEHAIAAAEKEAYGR